jgi:hypothetical protein
MLRQGAHRQIQKEIPMGFDDTIACVVWSRRRKVRGPMLRQNVYRMIVKKDPDVTVASLL